MDRRAFLGGAATAALASELPLGPIEARADSSAPFARVRPGDPGWPSPADWNALSNAVGGRLVQLDDPLAACRADPDGEACKAFLAEMRNPYFISDNPALTESSGWVDAWTSRPSAYAVKAQTTADVVAAVNFAREHDLRLVVKGGGHNYQGTSDSADSLLIWTRDMSGIVLHDAFTPARCGATLAPQPAVSVGTGARWMAAYQAVTTRGGRYVQGGGCATVGVAGFISGGGFGSFSKLYGQGAAALLEAEIVTADGAVLVVNACNHPDLFWAVKGGGGGSFGVLTRLTLRTRPLPETFGGVFGKVRATSDAAFRRLVEKTLRFYAEELFNPHWGEQLRFGPDNALTVHVAMQGLTQAQAEAVWAPFIADLAAPDFEIETPLGFVAGPAQRLWDPAYMAANHPGMLAQDDRPGAPSDNVFWAGDDGEAGRFWHGYKSAWMPASLLQPAGLPHLADAVFAGSRHKTVAFHFNKGLAGAPPEEIAAARDTAMNPDVLDAFALVIIGGGAPPAFPGVPGLEPDLDAARKDAEAIEAAMAPLRRLAPGAGSYLSEADYFEPDWKRSFWGSNFERLAEVKRRYDPHGLFFVHHGVGSDEWSPDGFTRLS